MKIFICASKYFYHLIPEIETKLRSMGHNVTFPNCYDTPMLEEIIKKEGEEKHKEFKKSMFKAQEKKVKDNEAILVLNYEKNGQKNYIGGSTFLEIFKAFEFEKRIYFMNPLPDNILRDELIAMSPIVLYGDLTKIR